jgi:lipopolysaccharide export system protein LptC
MIQAAPPQTGMSHVTASALEGRTRSFQARGRTDGEHAYRRAMRHSRWVRFWRLAIPLGIAGILGIIFVFAYFRPLQVLSRLPIDPSKLVISGTKITMEAPRLAGFTRDGRAYELTAAAAAQDLANPDVLELKQIRARMEMQDKGVLRLAANTGIYNTKTDVLRLRDHIEVSSSGYEGRLSEAVVDVKKGVLVSEAPVELKMLNGTLNANRLEVTENGDAIFFDRGVQMLLTLGDKTDPVGATSR